MQNKMRTLGKSAASRHFGVYQGNNHGTLVHRGKLDSAQNLVGYAVIPEIDNHSFVATASQLPDSRFTIQA